MVAFIGKIIAVPIRMLAEAAGLVTFVDPTLLWSAVWKLSNNPHDGSRLLILTYIKYGIEAARQMAEEMLTKTNIYVPEDQKWRLKSYVCFYSEWRTNDECFVKIYNQKRLVKYADYKIGMWYISPFDLTSDKYPELIKKIRQRSAK